MIEAKDFSSREKFPGLSGNPFDILLHRAMDLEKIPSGMFVLLLLVVCIPGYPVNGWFCLLLLPFFLFDWISISLLPISKRSFGPLKPQVLLLALCRLIPVLICGPIIWIPLEILGCGLQVYGFWIEPYKIKLSTQYLTTAKLPAGAVLRMLHIGDLHLERLSIREVELNRMISEIKPDLILFSGDFLNLSSLENRKAWDDLKRVLNEWHAPFGVFGVTGSPAVDLEENFPKLVDGTPIRLMKDETLEITINGSTIKLIGLACSHKPHEDFPRLDALIKDSGKDFSILVHHSPDLAPHAQDLPIDLFLAGHTHGGQVRLPLIGPIFTGSLYGLKFKSGRYLLKKLTMYITRGLGVEGLSAPRVRFLCPPEIILWTIKGE